MEDVYESQVAASNHQYQHEDAAMNMEWANNYDYDDQELLSDQDLEYLDDCINQILDAGEDLQYFSNYNSQQLVADQDQHLLRDCYQDVPSVQLRELPPGFVFAPSDQELLSMYLKPKKENPEIQFEVMPCIPDINVYQYHPKKLLETYQEKSGYFFTRRTIRYANGKRPIRTVGGHGHWRMSTKTEPVMEGSEEVGKKSGLVFHTVGRQGDKKSNTKTNWLMKEYHMTGSEWTLCRIYLNK
ncbi:hypothetical protein C5167_000070 [Papaver somniferum]|uniref:NAC domain-containing protein n=1 Tax=Papaver somniferum TaxID=3469 RepID=A0A4Y7KR23_PAPSO|nr:hypothetical protein C5167_000070 [Papaver somniferum]